MKKTGHRVLLLASVASAVWAAPALAQQDAEGEPGDGKDEIVVTGTRLISNGNDLPTPVTVITTAQIQNTTPTNIADGLNKLPQFVGSRSQAVRSGPAAANSGNFLNLRNFGIIRTLILLDGHRASPTNADQTVDVNLLPQLLVNRVDIVTGGVSAVYGSDAVTGVVNFVLDKKYRGIKGIASAGISERGDAFNWRLGLAGGMDFAGGRGHVIASYEHYKADPLGPLSRPAVQQGIVGTGAGTAGNPFRTTFDAKITGASYAGLITSGPFAGKQFQNGVLVPFNVGTPTGTSNISSGGDGYVLKGYGVRASLKTDLAFVRADYDLTPDININIQGTYSATTTFNNFVDVGIGGTVSSTNAYIPIATQNQLLAAGVTSFAFGRQVLGEPAAGILAKNKGYNITAGIDGSLGDYKWQAFYTHSNTDQDVLAINNVDRMKQWASLDAVRAPDGTIVCNVTLTNPGLYPGCVPMNLLGTAAENAAAFKYRSTDTAYSQSFKMDNFGASITGSPFETWAGPVRVALSGEYRKLSIDLQSDSTAADFVNCTGLRFGEGGATPGPLVGNACSTTSLQYNFSVTNNLKASYNVIEAAVEADVPLLRDFALAKLLSVTGAARYTRYSNSGVVYTWKAGLNWQINDDLRFRGTLSRDIRAPTLLELYRQPSTTGGILNDSLHTGISAFGQIVTTGNPNLTPEIANTLALGAVYAPHWLPGLTIAVDYYRIRISNAIAGLSGSSATVRLLCEQSGGTSPYCDLIVRPGPFSDRSAANFPLRFLSQGLNVAKQEVRGVDVEVNYAFSPWQGGRMNLRGLVAYQPTNSQQTFPSEPVINNAGTAGAGSKWRTSLFAGYSSEFFDVNTQWTYRSGLARTGDSRIIWADGPLPSIITGDLTLTYKPRKDLKLFFTVENLLDKDPRISANAGDFPGNNIPIALGDDIIGRRFTAGVRLGF